MTCLRKNSSVLGLVTTRNKHLGSDNAIKSTRSCHVETVVLLSKLNTKQHIDLELKTDELDLTSSESKATYDEIKAYVKEHAGLSVSSESSLFLSGNL